MWLAFAMLPLNRLGSMYWLNFLTMLLLWMLCERHCLHLPIGQSQPTIWSGVSTIAIHSVIPPWWIGGVNGESVVARPMTTGWSASPVARCPHLLSPIPRLWAYRVDKVPGTHLSASTRPLSLR